MSDKPVAVQADDESQSFDIAKVESGLLEFVGQHGLPADGILVPVVERGNALRNVGAVVSQVPGEQRIKATYISKFIAAATVGLFDASLNYLWDQTIYELRERVAAYDIKYFFDIAIKSEHKRKTLKLVEDLQYVDDSDLIKGAHSIGLISDIGFQHLDYIRYMRNWASAAHPNQNEITGLQLISWLETCIKEVINLPPSTVVVEIRRLLANIKENQISPTEAAQIGVFFADLNTDSVGNLTSGFFGIYIDPAANQHTRENIAKLLPLIWDRVDEEVRSKFGARHAQYLANNEQRQAQLSREFLELVSAVSYIPDGIRAVEVEESISELLRVHNGFDNFHNEPSIARQLQQIIGASGDVPKKIEREYVNALVSVFLSNGRGVAWNAEPIYSDLMGNFDAHQALLAIVSYRELEIASKLRFDLCEGKYRDLLGQMRVKVTAPAIVELIDEIEGYEAGLFNLKSDTRIKRKLEGVLPLLSR